MVSCIEEQQQSSAELSAGDKIRFHLKGVGRFVAYVKYVSAKGISLKGCKLIEATSNAYEMNKLDISYYQNQHTHSFAHDQFEALELLEKSPF